MTPPDNGRSLDDERIPILGELRGDVTVVEPMVIREISRHGAQVETAVPLQLNSLHQFRLVLGYRSVVVSGRVAHCHVSEVAPSGTVYRSGIEFLELSEPVALAIRGFLDAVKRAREAI